MEAQTGVTLPQNQEQQDLLEGGRSKEAQYSEGVQIC